MARLRVKARAIDMLGRQQIAGVPTAIHELFKNAHDAYADRVSVDYFRSDALFVLRDDGIGMTEEEFQQRWLTVGTDSKVENGTLPLPIPEGVERARPILGEKGIGRLAIATIGPLVLVLTRSRRQPPPNGVTAALVHWGFFAIPGLDLDRIDIPVITIRDDERPDATLVNLLKGQVEANASALAGEAPEAVLARITADIRRFELDLSALYSEIGGPSLDGDGRQGTHFYILPADRIIESDIDDAAEYVASPLTKALLGFSDTMVPGASSPPIIASFRDHRLDGTSNELVSDRSFFTPEEFLAADHHFSGEFDQFGQFSGQVAIFGGDLQPYRVSWANPNGRPTECGPFRLNFAYVQGAARESRLEPDEYARMAEKLNRIGGLYLYRDGVRILPYGNSDYDFLDIERRRTKGAAYYFFSHRRMFGAIQTTRALNAGLVEKAGREGFQENRAYRQFKQMLEGLLVQLAADFFREDGAMAETYVRVRAEMERTEEVRRRRERQTRPRRAAFAAELEDFFGRVDAKQPEREADRLREAAAVRLRTAAGAGDRERAAAEMLRVAADVLQTVGEMQDGYRVRKPPGLGLTKPLLREWASYRERAERLQREVFAPLAVHVDRVFGEAVAEFDVPLDRRRRTEEVLRETAARQAKDVTAASRAASDRIATAAEGVKARARAAVSRMAALVEEALSEFASTDISLLPDGGLDRVRESLERRVLEAGQAYVADFVAMADRAAAVLEVAAERNGDELTEALEERVEALRDENDMYVELAQLGMAVGVVQHDFIEAIKVIRSGLRSMQPWADANRDLAGLHSSIRTAFEHLDGYLTLFTPLNRRLYRSAVTMRGENIALFLDGLFAERLAGTNVHLVCTDAFRAGQIEGYPSTFFPVFVNLVENARHWVTEAAARPGRITLDLDGRDFTVTDTGPGIPERDREAVFEYGFTRKGAGGQGLGLFISRQVLGRAGWRLELDPPAEGRGARFRLVPPEPHVEDRAP